MIPFDFFYKSIYDNFLKDVSINSMFIKLTSNNIISAYTQTSLTPTDATIIFYDQEPLDKSIFINQFARLPRYKESNRKILVTSEQNSSDYTSICQSDNVVGFDYFYHALLCIEWYRHHWYNKIPDANFDRTYITYNNLMLGKRLYRANLLIELRNRNLIDRGYVSFNTPSAESITKSIDAYRYLLPASHKLNLLSNINLLDQKFVLDSNTVDGNYSAKLDLEHLRSGFVNLVTETVYYENKVHLTEKVFKPIVSKMPFILLAGAGNLEYLRSYGFKTFGDYWDESYDSIVSPAQRFDAVLNLLTRLSNLSIHELRDMHNDMLPILEHNYNHFYRDLRGIVANELTTKLGAALTNIDVKYDSGSLQNLNRILAY